MNDAPDLADLTALAAIATHRSFRKAAEQLNLAPSTLSHMIRTLEARLGVRLLHRTTRSVAPTEVGERLISRIKPLLAGLDQALSEVHASQGSPIGTLRINATETATRALLKDVVPTFLGRHPGMTLDLVTDGELVDIVASGFDAGIRLGDALPQDVVAVRFGGPMRFVTVAAPAYLAGHPPPRTPDDLMKHDCIRVRMPSGKLYRWEFSRRGQQLVLDVPGRLLLDHMGLMIEAAADGLGIAYVLERAAQPWLDDGRLVAVLADWCPEIAGLNLYYAGGRHVPNGLRAFIDVLKETLGEPVEKAGIAQGNAASGPRAPRARKSR